MHNLVFVLLLYIYVFNPFFNFWGGYSAHIILLPLLIFLLKHEPKSVLIYDKKIVATYIYILLFVMIRTLLGGDMSLIRIFVSQFISNILYTAVLGSLAVKCKIDIRDTVVKIGIIAVFFSILCLIIPSFGMYVRTSLISFGDEYTRNYMENNLFRGFGIASGLTYDYGLILATIYSYCLFWGKTNNLWFVFFVPFLILSIFVNARTGVIVLAISTMLYFLTKKYGGRFLAKEILIIMIAVTLFYSLIDEGTKWFIESFFDEISDLTRSGESRTSSALAENLKVLPNNILEWIWGKGELVLYEDVDVGLILQLNFGGLLFLLLLITQCYVLIHKVNDNYLKYSIIFLIIIADFKGNFFFNSGSFRMITFMILAESYITRHRIKSLMENRNTIR